MNNLRTKGRRLLACASLLGGLVALVGSGGAAQGAPRLQFTQWPTLSGTAQVGSELDAVGAQWTGPSNTQVEWHWLRCSDADHCELIDGDDATDTTYSPQDADVGDALVAWVRISANNRHRDAWTDASDPVAPAPPPPPPPKPKPAPKPPPKPTPPVTPAAPAVVVPAPAPAAVEPRPVRPRMLKPFPVVRIRGRLTADGVRLTLVTVRAPRGARVSISCRGRGCPARRLARTAKLLRMRRFEAPLRAGTRLRVTVSKRGYIAKVTTFRIRRGRVPLRSDECRWPGRKKVQACPGG